jgi:hypothetical protein
LVSGKPKILVVWNQQQAEAVIEKIYKPSDLALLRLLSPLNIPSMSLYSGVPLNTPLNYWETPAGSTQMTGKQARLEQRTVLQQLNPRVSDPAGFQKALCSAEGQGYPLLSTPVYKFAEPNVQKSHSGSPLTLNNQLVGMIDGGARPVNGTAASLWAIPAAEFNKLFASGTPLPAQMSACSSENLYGGLRSDNPLLSKEEQQQARAFEQAPGITFTDEGGSTFTVRPEYQLSFEEVLETLFDEEYERIEELISSGETNSSGEPVNLDDLLLDKLNVYQEAETGASFALPSNCVLSTEKEGPHTLILASSPYEGITLYLYVFGGDSPEEAQEAKDWFIEYMNSDGEEWISPDRGMDGSEDFLSDEYNPYFAETVETMISDQDDVPIARLFTKMIQSESYFLGVAVHVSDWNLLADDPEERGFFYLLEACASITDFPYY